MSTRLLLLACLSLPAVALAGTPDPNVQAQLDAKGVKYEIDGDGDYKVIYEVGQGRTQLAYVRSVTATYGSLTVREIWSPGFAGKGGHFPSKIANALLLENHETKIGAWEAQADGAMFVVRLEADASADQLVDAIEAAVQTADAFEEKVTGKKDVF